MFFNKLFYLIPFILNRNIHKIDNKQLCLKLNETQSIFFDIKTPNIILNLNNTSLDINYLIKQLIDYLNSIVQFYTESYINNTILL